VIRQATFEDVPAIVELFERSFATLTFLPTVHTHEQNLAYFDSVLHKQEVWVHDDAGTLRGFITISDMVDHLYLEPDAFGTGVAAALFEHAKGRRPDGFTLWVFQQNARARRFYERHGCHAIMLTDGAFNEERAPDVLYEWRP